MARGCRQVATPWPEEASGRPHHGRRRLEDVGGRQGATPRPEEASGRSSHGRSRLAGSHALVEGGS
nr:hypothetical protein Itr_chr10CG20460 [Ipomoea trifida]